MFENVPCVETSDQTYAWHEPNSYKRCSAQRDALRQSEVCKNNELEDPNNFTMSQFLPLFAYTIVREQMKFTRI